jgi:nucleoside-diphosphate-sugar epimerase
LSNQKLVIYGTGKQKRDYFYIDDFIKLLVLLMKPTVGNAQIYNVGKGEGISILSAANQIIKLAKKGTVDHRPWPKLVEKVETGDYVSDITKITTELQWKPTTSFKEGIQKTLAWY